MIDEHSCPDCLCTLKEATEWLFMIVHKMCPYCKTKDIEHIGNLYEKGGIAKCNKCGLEVEV